MEWRVNKRDWPTEVPGVDMTLEELYTALDRLDEVDDQYPPETLYAGLDDVIDDILQRDEG